MILKFKTISSVILSQRAESALYEGIDFKATEDKIKIIYPFYSYEYRNFNAKNTFKFAEKYYIPASSLKGALLSEEANTENKIFNEEIRKKILIEDIELNKSQIQLNNIFKFQYLYQQCKEFEKENNNSKNKFKYKAPKLENFFPTLRIEMLKSNENFEGNISLKISEEEFYNKLKNVFITTKKKLKRYINEIDSKILEINSWKKYNNEDSNAFDEAIKKLEIIKKSINDEKDSDKNMIFLGGYKGILGSISKDISSHKNIKIQNGFYIDTETNLPYGLIEVLV